jgi:hypothetical protein
MRDFGEVVGTLRQLLRGLEPVVAGLPCDDHEILHDRIRNRLQEYGDMFVNPVIPHELWCDVWTLVLRSCSSVVGFSYGLSMPGDIRSSGDNPVEQLIQDVIHLSNRVRVELFEATERDACIREVCNRVLADFKTGS